MQVVLLRVGIDSGYGGGLGPIFEDDTFEFVPIPGRGAKYKNLMGRHGRVLTEYFTGITRFRLERARMHYDPEWLTYSYGDSKRLKRSLARLKSGDILAFYAGLKGWGHERTPALYLIGYFTVAWAGFGSELNGHDAWELFRLNAHWKYSWKFRGAPDKTVLIKGLADGASSRLLDKAVKISDVGKDKIGRPIYVLSEEMCHVFGDFGGINAIQRCAPRWVSPECVERAAEYVKSLGVQHEQRQATRAAIHG